VCAFEDECRKQRRDAVLSLKRKTELARKNVRFEVAEEKETSVSSWIVRMVNMKTAKR
jgi:hypothetical protein